MVGKPVSGGGGYTQPICKYGANGGGGVSVTLELPALCKLLFLALDKNLFGRDQVRVDDVGQAGMLVKGEGNVQFVVKGGCVTIDAYRADSKVDDATMLDLGRRAAKRVT